MNYKVGKIISGIDVIRNVLLHQVVRPARELRLKMIASVGKLVDLMTYTIR
ncbi:hypothetical protein LGL08_00125 [Clostridium estertheticum]|uniref:hypothetical protein n=1 Tax=Clostridium estertheticum TaxID=238834 RepID=UPI001CF0F445|nr:hypothetical protein [Clostridium estertheticum]MCB2305620.1 hypothetical protein [Clostridium estertheticum]MCB2344564.1 hypothetical protein [Clostridium estertheticum]MCB2347976.1 hypothetical protein [Clostridium estertheticum]WAG45620.1 hypothetical protein LL127_19205 [Clostridium estertheticum]